jgi:hypothetical protein
MGRGNIKYFILSIICMFLKYLYINPQSSSSLLLEYSSRAGGVVQVVDHLPSKCEALSSNSNTAKLKMNILECSLTIFDSFSLMGIRLFSF